MLAGKVGVRWGAPGTPAGALAIGGAAAALALASHRPVQAKHGPEAATSVHDSRLQGSFIYTGSGKKQSKTASKAQQLCAKKARDMQWCLAKNNHKEKWCKAVIDVWRKCQEDVKAAEAKEEAERAGAADARGDSNPRAGREAELYK
jgi:hypothetical protein